VESEHERAKASAQEALEDNVTLENKTPGIGRAKSFLAWRSPRSSSVSAYFATRRGALTPATGSATSAAITLVTSDRADVDCVSAKDLNGLRCGFSTEIANWQGDEQNKLKPFFTTDRRMYLIPVSSLSRRLPPLPIRASQQAARNNSSASRLSARSRLSASWPGLRTHWIATPPGRTPRTLTSRPYRAARSKV